MPRREWETLVVLLDFKLPTSSAGGDLPGGTSWYTPPELISHGGQELREDKFPRRHSHDALTSRQEKVLGGAASP